MKTLRLQSFVDLVQVVRVQLAAHDHLHQFGTVRMLLQQVLTGKLHPCFALHSRQLMLAISVDRKGADVVREEVQQFDVGVRCCESGPFGCVVLDLLLVFFEQPLLLLCVLFVVVARTGRVFYFHLFGKAEGFG